MEQTKTSKSAKSFFNILKNMTSTPDELPKLRYHVADDVVNFADSYLLSVVKLDGVIYESISDAILEADFDAMNLAFAEAAKDKAGKMSFMGYQLRRKINVDTTYHFENKFCQDFANKYVQRFNDRDYYENKFYLAITLKYDGGIEEGIDELQSVVVGIVKKLSKYNPEILSAYKNKHGILCSQVFEFYSEIANNEKLLSDFPLTATPAFDAIPYAGLHFGYEILQSKGFGKDRYAICLNLKDFPASTKLGMLNKASLALPFEYNLVHSFTALAPAKSLHRIKDQLNRLRSTNDQAGHQQDELFEAQGYIQSGELAFGDYYSCMIVYGDSIKDVASNTNFAVANFSNMASAIYRKSLLASPATFFSQFPLAKNIPRRMMKSSRNFAAAFSMHNYSRGKSKGNPLGDGSAIMPLETQAKTLYDFNFHFTNPLEDTIGDAVAGHTLILGATGAGKTTLQSALVAFVQRFNPAMFVLDKDRGMEIFIRALDGDYFSLEEGKSTGINPFQFKDTPQLREFLNELVVSLVTDASTPCTSEEQNQIKNAIDSVMNTNDIASKRLSTIIQAIPKRGGNGLRERLAKWCAITETGVGRFAWVLDNPINKFNPDDFKITGFDIGGLLKEGYQPSEPILACLLYLKSQMTKNHDLLCTIVEEFWLPLKYKTPRDMMVDVLKTGRKRGEFMILVTQSPEEAVQSEIFPAIVQQTPTKILLPNPDAEYKNEQGGGYSRIGLTVKEFLKLKALALESRTFLVKQGHNSSFATLDLYGFSDEIAVLSGTTANVEILSALLDKYAEKNNGVVPKSDVWLPSFYRAVKLRKSGYNNLDTIISESMLSS